MSLAGGMTCGMIQAEPDRVPVVLSIRPPVRPARETMRTVPLDEAQQRLPELMDEAAGGEEVVISRGDGASFRLVPIVASAPRPVFGSARGLIEIASDFDAPLEGFEPYAP